MAWSTPGPPKGGVFAFLKLSISPHCDLDWIKASETADTVQIKRPGPFAVHASAWLAVAGSLPVEAAVTARGGLAGPVRQSFGISTCDHQKSYMDWNQRSGGNCVPDLGSKRSVSDPCPWPQSPHAAPAALQGSEFSSQRQSISAKTNNCQYANSILWFLLLSTISFWTSSLFVYQNIYDTAQK